MTSAFGHISKHPTPHTHSHTHTHKENGRSLSSSDIDEQKDGNSEDLYANGEAVDVSQDEMVVHDRAENDYTLPPELQGQSECSKL